MSQICLYVYFIIFEMACLHGDTVLTIVDKQVDFNSAGSGDGLKAAHEVM